MNKQELIKKIEAIPYDEGVIVDKLEINRAGLIKLIEQFDEPQPLRLKDIIARMEGLSSHVRSEWLDDILCKFGSDYGVSKYQAGYEQGKFEGSLIPYKEPEKVTIQQFVADWIEKCKSEKRRLHEALTYTPFGVNSWISNPKNQETFARAWLDGYDVEKEKRYYVRFKGMESDDFNYLNFIKFQHAWVLSSLKLDKKFRTEHTKKQLEEANFGWVFDCEGIEIEEVEDE